MLVNRGVCTVEAARAFLRPSLASLPDPYQMADAEVAAERLCKAIVDGERICVYGDYDVDGVSSSALLATFLRSVDAPARVFLPDRFVDGYGLNLQRVEELSDEGVDLFISVDCGSNAIEPIAAARARGCDFIVCDHHQLGAQLPDTTALLNPRRPDCRYPADDLCAVGVALVLVQATRRKLSEAGFFGGRPPSISALLEFAALGTIADMVPLQGVNRMLAWHGLRRLGRSRSPGVVALAQQSRLQGISKADHVGFMLGPRINAAGRVADARTAYELLTTTDRARALELARFVEVQNNRRRALQREVTEAALAAADEVEGREHAVVVADPGWHAGVVGIVAARVKDAFSVPTFVLSIEDGVAKGSGRSVEGYDLVAGLRRLADKGLFSRFGGHYFAAGVTLPAEEVGRFAAALAQDVQEILPMEARRKRVQADAEAEVARLTLQTADELDCLEPHGRGNRKPQLLIRHAVVAGKRLLGADKAWARLRLVEDNDRPLWGRKGADLFCAADRASALEDGDVVSAVVRLQRNHFRGDVTLQLSPVAFGPPSPEVVVVTGERRAGAEN